MYRNAATGGKYWVSNEGTRWTDWRGRQSYRYHLVDRRHQAER